MPETSAYSAVQKACGHILSQMKWGESKPQTAIVLGSGLGAFAEHLKREPKGQAIPYRDISHFPHSTVEGHRGELVYGHLMGQYPILVMSGRVHGYEGYSPQEVVFPIRVLGLLGMKNIILTNAAAGLLDELHPGNLMLIRDHINLTGQNCLIGPNQSEFGPRFVDMQNAYSLQFRKSAQEACAVLGQKPLFEGVYLGVTGPTYETPAEIRMFQGMGADAVGMSTVLETIAARHLGLSVLGLSCITNKGAGLSSGKITHEEVALVASQTSGRFQELLKQIIVQMPI